MNGCEANADIEVAGIVIHTLVVAGTWYMTKKRARKQIKER